MAGVTAMTIRPMGRADVEAVLIIEQVAYPQPWTEGIFSDELAAPGRTYLVAEDDGRVVGYGGLLVVEEDAHVTTVAVDPVRRGGGIGTRLMLALVEAGVEAGAHSLTLEVRASNQAAQALYRCFGMGPVGIRKNYYRDEDALIMWAHDIHRPEYAERLAEIRSHLR